MANNGEAPRTRQTVGNTHSKVAEERATSNTQQNPYHLKDGDKIILKYSTYVWFHGRVLRIEGNNVLLRLMDKHTNKEGGMTYTTKVYHCQRVVRTPAQYKPWVIPTVQATPTEPTKQTIGYKI